MNNALVNDIVQVDRLLLRPQQSVQPSELPHAQLRLLGMECDCSPVVSVHLGLRVLTTHLKTCRSAQNDDAAARSPARVAASSKRQRTRAEENQAETQIWDRRVTALVSCVRNHVERTIQAVGDRARTVVARSKD